MVAFANEAAKTSEFLRHFDLYRDVFELSAQTDIEDRLEDADTAGFE